MTWWGLLIFGVILIAATATIVYLLVRRVAVDVDRLALASSREAKTQALLESERKRRKRLEEIATELEAKLKSNREWFDKRMENIDEEIEAEYRDLASDDGALLGRLAELLRGGSAPAGARGEGDDPDEGSEGSDGRDPPDPATPGRPPEGGGEASSSGGDGDGAGS